MSELAGIRYTCGKCSSDGEDRAEPPELLPVTDGVLTALSLAVERALGHVPCGTCGGPWPRRMPQAYPYTSVSFGEPVTPCTCITAHDRMLCVGCCKKEAPQRPREPDVGLLGRRMRDLISLAAATANGSVEGFDAAASILAETLLGGGKILVCGNGGSASQAQHFAAELTGRYRATPERRPLPAIALCADSAALTCIANDFGYEQVFARQVDALCASGDALLCLSTSGRSENVRLAACRAAVRGARVVWVTGAVSADVPVPPGANWVPIACDAWVRIPSTDTALIQEVTLSVIHSFCERIEEEVGR